MNPVRANVAYVYVLKSGSAISFISDARLTYENA